MGHSCVAVCCVPFKRKVAGLKWVTIYELLTYNNIIIVCKEGNRKYLAHLRLALEAIGAGFWQSKSSLS